ncbi:hypothetical protein [Mycetocola sp.]|uniref:hypothetical protein n=1 Tax=Mycetocola sp. TaxID=1871042 RepID=UPI0039896A6F
MWDVIGVEERGEFPGSVVAFDFSEVEPDEFAEFACWVPHRYTLSIERNIVPRDLALEACDALVDRIDGNVDLGERFFNQDYVQVVRGPREGTLLPVPAHSHDLTEMERILVRLASRTPLVRAMAHAPLFSIDFSTFLEELASEATADRDVPRLLRHASRSVDWTSDVMNSPDVAVQMWLASVFGNWKAGDRDERPARIRDARRMARALLGRGQYWASGDWGDELSRIVGISISWLVHGETPAD